MSALKASATNTDGQSTDLGPLYGSSFAARLSGIGVLAGLYFVL